MNKKLILLAILFTLGFSFSSTPCTGNDTLQVGDLCLSETELQTCNDNLGELDGTAQNNTSITNECEPYLYNNDTQAYEFDVQFINGYQPNLDCLDFAIKFENDTLSEGNATFDEWQYNPTDNNILFNVLHSTFEDKCNATVSDDAYIWLCNMSLEITMGGEVQLTYNFKIQVTMNRNAVDTSLVVDVIQNVVEGYCCENELNIETELNFCSDYSCGSYLSSPLTVQRGETFYVEHSITSPEFTHYFLEGLQIKLGPYFANIISTNGTQPGKFIWEVKGNIAMSNLTVEAISRIHNEDPNRRFLEAQLGENYKLKGINYMTVLTEDQQETESQQETKVVYKTEQIQIESTQNNDIIMYSIIAVAALTLLSILGATIYCIKSRKSSQKYEVQQTINTINA